MINEKKLKKILGNYKTGTADAIDKKILNKVIISKKKISSSFIAIDKEDIKKRILDENLVVTRKLDGEFHVLYYKSNKAYLIKPSGAILTGLTCTDQAAKAIKKSGKFKSALFPGELYVKNEDGSRSRVFDTLSIVRKPESEEDLEKLHFAPFDIIEQDNKNYVPETYKDEIKLLNEIFDDTHIKPVEYLQVKSNDEITKIYEEWIEKEDSEGLVVRGTSSLVYKVKPRHSLDAVIIGYSVGIDDRQDRLSSVLVALMRPNGMLQVLAKVGGGFSEEDRVHMLKKLKKLDVDSEFMMTNRHHLPYIMVKPEIIMELNFLDAITTNSTDETFDKMVLNFDKKSGYKIVRKMPFVSLISPRYIRERDDKKVNEVDLRISQISDLFEIKDADKDVEKVELANEEILIREVYTKTSKEKTMVRKFLAWKTNKEKLDPSFPAYVFNYTDFSPNREDTLKQDVRISSDKKQIMDIVKKYQEKNIKKGWEKAEK